jgi:hypothetical protein
MEESENKHVFDELASQEHIRALETQVSVLNIGAVASQCTVLESATYKVSLFWGIRLCDARPFFIFNERRTYLSTYIRIG